MSSSALYEPVAQAKLDIFRKNRIQVTQIGFERVYLSPHNAVHTNSKQVIFKHLGKNTDFYRYLSDIYLDIDFTLANADGTAVDATKEAALINYFNQTCIESVDIKLNDTYITRNTRNYPLRAYIESLLTTNSTLTEKGQLAAAGFYMDAGADLKADSAANSGFKKRLDLLSGGKLCCTIGRLHTDIGTSELFLPNGLDLEVIINFVPDAFLMMSKADHDGVLKMLGCNLCVEICHINPEVINAHSKVFQDTNCHIPFQHVEVRTESVAKGLTTVQLDNVINGPLPSVILLGICDNAALAGQKTSNPLIFKHYNLQSVIFNVNGRPHTIAPFNYTATPKQYSAGYQSLLAATGLLRRGESCLITFENYPQGLALLGLDNTADGDAATHGTHSSLRRVGNIGVTANFGSALTDSVTFCFYCLWENCAIEIDKFRNVFVSF